MSVYMFMFTKFGHILSTKDKYFEKKASEKNTMPVYLYDLNAERRKLTIIL